MALADLVFSVTSTGDTIYDPETLTTASTLGITITNMGEDDLTDLGLYVVPCTTAGDVDNPADFPPETDYQDLLRWGEETENAVTLVGGLKVTLPQNSAPDKTSYITRTQGSLRSNKLPMADIPAGDSVDITLEMETPPSVSSRRVYISVVVDTDT